MPPMPEALLPLLAMPPLLLLSAAASGSETALFSLSPGERRALTREHPEAGRRVEALLARPRRLLVLILLVNMLANVSYFVASSLLTTRLGIGAAGLAAALGSVLAIVLFGEVLAKLVAVRNRALVGRVVAGPLLAIRSLLGPALVALDLGLIGPLTRLVRGGRPRSRPLLAADVERLLREIEGTEGGLDESALRLVGDVLALGSRRVSDVMRPRVDLPWVRADATPDEVTALATESGRTLLPVEDSRVGAAMLHAKPFLAAATSAGGGPLPSVARYCDPAVFVPERARLDDLLGVLTARGATEALVVDEHGEITGLVGLDDVADELLGGIAHRDPGPDRQIRLIGLGVWSVPGRTPLREFVESFGEEAAGFRADDERAATVGGLVADRLGRLPEPGDRVDLASASLEVRSIEGRVAAELWLRLREGVA